MTEPLFFDTDCISAFLWVDNKGNTIWKNMIARRRKLGYATFSEYLAEHCDDK